MSALRRSNEALQDNDDACLYPSLKCRAWGAGNPVSASYGCGHVYCTFTCSDIGWQISKHGFRVLHDGKYWQLLRTSCMIWGCTAAGGQNGRHSGTVGLSNAVVHHSTTPADKTTKSDEGILWLVLKITTVYNGRSLRKHIYWPVVIYTLLKDLKFMLCNAEFLHFMLDWPLVEYSPEQTW